LVPRRELLLEPLLLGIDAFALGDELFPVVLAELVEATCAGELVIQPPQTLLLVSTSAFQDTTSAWK
jgi:hypothetical protein